MNGAKERICVTGSRGYLARQVIDRLKNTPNVEFIFGIDKANLEAISVDESPKQASVVHSNLDMANPLLAEYLNLNKITSCLHLGWWFNPTHKTRDQWKVNVEGTENVIRACLKSKTVNYLFYSGSSTAYGQLDDPGEWSLSEEDWQRNWQARLEAAYPYARQKAHVDLFFQRIKDLPYYRPGFHVGWMRGAIVAGQNTRNVVTDVAEAFGPVMFRAKGCNPLMQFVTERDTRNFLYRAIMEKWTGPINFAGTGTIRFNQVVELLGKKEIVLPFWMLYAFCWLGWKIRWGDRSLLPFPPSILHLITKPWVGKIDRLRREFNFEPQDSSVDAIRQLKEGLNKRRGK